MITLKLINYWFLIYANLINFEWSVKNVSDLIKCLTTGYCILPVEVLCSCSMKWLDKYLAGNKSPDNWIILKYSVSSVILVLNLLICFPYWKSLEMIEY